ncbi:MAG: response regulator [Chloroflexota bacterium]
MAGAKILVVDDRRENIQFLAGDILIPQGYEVITARDGEKGLQRALEEKPDLIITDRKMPKMNGDEMIQALRERGYDTPVILTTFHGSERTAIEAFRAGATDYIIKPFTVEEILGAVERALARQAPKATPPVAPGPTPADAPQQVLERRLTELSTILDIGKAVTSLLDLEQLLSRIVEAAVYLSKAEEGYLMLLDSPTGELYLRSAWSYGDKHAKGFRLKVEDSLTGQVVKTGKPVILKPPPSGDARHKLKTGHLTKSMLAVPIKGIKEVIGVLSVDNIVKRTEFTEEHSRQLCTLAEYAAVAIENARLYRQAQERAEKLARLLEDQPAASAPPAPAKEAPPQPWITEAELNACHSRAAQLARQLRALAAEADQLAQNLEPKPPAQA